MTSNWPDESKKQAALPGSVLTVEDAATGAPTLRVRMDGKEGQELGRLPLDL